MEKTVFAIESSCDDTSVALIKGRFDQDILKEIYILDYHNITKESVHIPYGGVIPEIAAREHASLIAEVGNAILKSFPQEPIHSIAVCYGSGLLGSLLVGIAYAQGLALSKDIPLNAIDHIDSHLAPGLFLSEDFSLSQDLHQWIPIKTPEFPALTLTISGGHTFLGYKTSLDHWDLLGHSVDDACGEAFDKVAKLLGLAYPGGPKIESLAKDYQPEALILPIPKVTDRPTYLSFSGLKTAAKKLVDSQIPDQKIAWHFQEASFKHIYQVLDHAIHSSTLPFKEIIIAGGVAKNQRLRDIMKELDLPIRFAPFDLCTDNGIMVGLQSFLKYRDGWNFKPYARRPV